MSYTLTELVKITTPVMSDMASVAGVAVPEMNLAAEKIAGITYNARLIDGLPTASFRAVGSGKDNAETSYNMKEFPTKVLDASFTVDAAFIDAQMANGASEAEIIGAEWENHFQGAMVAASTALYYGGANCICALSTQGIQQLDAGGSAASCSLTTGLTSAYLVRTGPKDFRWLMGKGGFEVADSFKDVVGTDGNGKEFDGKRMICRGWLGYAFSNPKSIV
jgi:hypothetical protein